MAASNSSSELQDLLAAVTDALLADELDMDTLVAQYNVPRAAVDQLAGIIRRLHRVLTGVQPSARYIERLRKDLIGSAESGLLRRFRYLPARVQIATGIAVIAGFMLITRRRMLGDARENTEVPVLH